MPDLDTRTVGNGPKSSAMWLDGVPSIVKGFTEWPKVGERHVIDGVLYRLVEISNKWIREKEATSGSPSLVLKTSTPNSSPS